MKLELGIHHYFEFISLLAGCFFYHKLKNSYMKWFLPFLAIILLLELVSNFLFNTYRYSNYWLSETSHLVAIGFYAFIFWHMADEKKFKLFIVLLTAFFFLILFITIGVRGLNRTVFINSLVGGGFVMIIFSALVFYQYLQRDDLSQMSQMISNLWLAAGILIFYSGIELVMATLSFSINNKLTLFGMPLYNAMPRLLCVVLYSCISISFYTWKTRNR